MSVPETVMNLLMSLRNESVAAEIIQQYKDYSALRKSHDELLAACNQLVLWANNENETDGYHVDNFIDEINFTIKQAIKNAEEVEK